ncbi:MAG: hypothetical protein HYS05_14255 [Acidobacteria bacterium]|nr:hypothetical protein [Acidobacteriota bacterium]
MRASAWRPRLLVPLALIFTLAHGSAADAAKYNNTLFGYSVDYPAWWTIDAKTLSDGVRFVMPGSDAIWMQIRVAENPEGQSLDDLLVVLLKTLSGTPAGLTNETGLPKPATAGQPGAATGAAGTVAAEAGQPGAAALLGAKSPAPGTEQGKPTPSIAVGGPPGSPVPEVDPTKPITGVTVRWITLDGAEAWYAQSEGQWIVKCLKDGFVYELSANSKFGTMYEWYFGSFFNSFRFQPRLGK